MIPTGLEESGKHYDRFDLQSSLFLFPVQKKTSLRNNKGKSFPFPSPEESKLQKQQQNGKVFGTVPLFICLRECGSDGRELLCA